MTKKYAAFEGCWGLATGRDICSSGYLVVRKNGVWVQTGIGSSYPGAEVSPEYAARLTIYRLTPTGPDGVWVEPPEPVDAVEGMAVAWYAHCAQEPDLTSREWAEACRADMGGIRYLGVGAGKHGGPPCYRVEWFGNPDHVNEYWSDNMLRCAATGRPLRLPS